MIQNVLGYAVTGAASNGDPRFVQTFTTPAGETGQINLSVLTITGSPYDMTGAAAVLTVKDKSGALIISRQATLNNPTTAGTGFFPLTVGDTLALAPQYAIGYTYDVWVTDSAGNRYQVIPVSPFVVEIARGQPNQAVTVPPSQQPLGQAPGFYTPANPSQWKNPAPTTAQGAIDRLAAIISLYVLDSTPIPTGVTYTWANPQPQAYQNEIDRLAAVVYADVLDGNAIP